MKAYKFDYYEKIKTKLEKNNFTVLSFEEINHGLQFYGSLNNKQFLIRIYESKKGVKLDFSQINDSDLKKKIKLLVNDIKNETVLKKDPALNKSTIEEIDESIEIIKALKTGKNKFTGEIYFKPHKNNKISHALQQALEALKKEKKKIIRYKNIPRRAGERWTKEEKAKLTYKYDIYVKSNMNDNDSIERLAKIHKRTYGAIASRLKKPGKLPPEFPT
ncbi:MAG: hypothetical protein ACOCRX_11045 [Candidatus Woesearchaeota archaeon]